MAVTRSTHTGMQPTTMTTLWLESACTWTWAEAGGELTVKLCYQEPCVIFPRQVSAKIWALDAVSLQLSGVWVIHDDDVKTNAIVCLSPALSISQEINHLSHMKGCVPLRGWNLDMAVTTLSLWCRNLHLRSPESTAGRKVGIPEMWFQLLIMCLICLLST